MHPAPRIIGLSIGALDLYPVCQGQKAGDRSDLAGNTRSRGNGPEGVPWPVLIRPAAYVGPLHSSEINIVTSGPIPAVSLLYC